MTKPLKCECGDCPTCAARERMRLHREQNGDHVRALDRARYRRDYAKRRAAADAYAQTPEGREAHARADARWRAANPAARAIAVDNANLLRYPR